MAASDPPPVALAPELERVLIAAQREELTGHRVYTRLARQARNPDNRRLLGKIAAAELDHYQTWARLTGRRVGADRWRVVLYVLLARLFGLTFGLKLMERGEKEIQAVYRRLAPEYPQAGRMLADEEEHERELLDTLDDAVLDNIGSVVLGLNDALVELTGALAGLSFAFQESRLIAIVGLITGVAAAFSMAASEYLSTRAEGGAGAARASAYTGVAYIVTVFLLILPYLVLDHYAICLAVTLVIAVLIILLFNFYLAVARDLDFRRRFLEMAGISLGVAAISFGIGVVVRTVFGVDA
jgi:VIT1/CCC1 family predicted Fe2+/Mn2+ transporter